MSVHRFNGVPINVDRLSQNELENLASYTRQRAAEAAGELALLDTYLQPTQEYDLSELQEALGNEQLSFPHGLSLRDPVELGWERVAPQEGIGG